MASNLLYKKWTGFWIYKRNDAADGTHTRPSFKMHIQLSLIVGLIFAHLLLTACQPFQPGQRNPQPDFMPDTYSQKVADFTPHQRWWEQFEDPHLNRLIERSLTGNATLQQRWARLAQARAQLAKTGAREKWTLSGNGGAAFSKRRTHAGTTSNSETYTLGVAAGYELDLWGRLQADTTAADRIVAASRQDLETAAISLAAQITRVWVQIISQQNQKRLLEQQLATNQTYLELVKLRFRKALVSALDVYQQRQLVERIRAQIPLIERRIGQLLHQLDVLTGQAPQTTLQIAGQPLPEPVSLPPGGLPADLIANRPDVQAAFSRLQAADWDVTVALTDRLPALRLSGGAGFEAGAFDLLLESWVLRLAANFTAPLFDSGSRQAEIERTRAVANEHLAAYRQTVLEALREVENALIDEHKLGEHIDALGIQLRETKNALREARSRYRNGLNDYLPVLTQLLSAQGLERDLMERKTDLMLARIDLYRALGGSWAQQLPTPPAVSVLADETPETAEKSKNADHRK